MTNGWDQSAAAWIAHMGDEGDYGRQYVLDAPMLACVRNAGAQTALDVGCGEGRFCRMLAAEGLHTTGIDPTAALISAAKARDPHGTYQTGRAEALDFPNSSFDLVVSYLTLIDIEHFEQAIAEMARVLKPGGRVLIANLTSFATAGGPQLWRHQPDGTRLAVIDNYLEQQGNWVSWGDIRIVNYHRPLAAYMQAFLANGLVLTHFDEPAPTGGDSERADRYRRAPYFLIMEWQKPL